MRFFIEVRAAPGTPGAEAACHFATAVGDSEHQLWKVFFDGEGALHADMRDGGARPDETPPLWQFWRDCADRTGAELLLCASAAQSLQDTDTACLCPAFTICGMVELVVPPKADVRLISFNS